MSFETDDFDPTEFLNSIFMSEESLSNLDSVYDEIIAQFHNVDQEIQLNLRKSSKSSDVTSNLVGDAKGLVDDVIKRIDTLQMQSNETESVIKNVCGNIKRLDAAKHNLTSSIKVLKRLQMAQVAVSDLEIMAKQKSYEECADRILALSTVLNYFEEFDGNKILDEINSKFTALKRQIHNQIYLDFEEKIFGNNVDPSISKACKVVNSFGNDFRENIIDMFCIRFLDGYEKTFMNSSLGEIDNRYTWLKQKIDFYNLEYANIFPKEWKVPYFLSLLFCNQSKLQIQKILTSKKPTLQDFQHGFEQTSKFEYMLSESFGTEGKNELNEVVWKPAKEFIGSISTAFAEHTDLYIKSEKKYYSNMILRAKNNIVSKKRISIDTDNRLLRSAIELVQCMKKSIDKCGAFSVGSAIFDLFFVLKESIINYITEIGSIMPTKITSETDIQIVSLISNTTYYFSTVIDGLAERISKSVDEDQKALVRVDDTKDQLGDSIRSQLKTISYAIIEETKPILEIFSNNTWQTGDEKTNFKFSGKICSFFNTNIPIFKKWICEENYASLRTIFIGEWVKTFFDYSFKCKLTNTGTERLSKSITEVKNVLIEQFAIGLRNENLHKHLIIKEFYLIENALTVYASPESAMVPIYIELFKNNPNKNQFIKILKAKNLSSSDETNILNEFDNAINKK